jgi:hypothetical protein
MSSIDAHANAAIDLNGSDAATAAAAAAAAKKKKKRVKKKRSAGGAPVCPYDHLQIHKLRFESASEAAAGSSGALPPLDSLCTKVNANAAHFCFEMRSSPHAGRFAVASRAVPAAGALVLRERAYAFCVRYQFLTHVCAHCASVFDIGAAQQQQRCACRACEQAHYCNAACRDAHAALHAWQCAALQDLESIVTSTNADVDLVRAALCVVAQREQH